MVDSWLTSSLRRLATAQQTMAQKVQATPSSETPKCWGVTHNKPVGLLATAPTGNSHGITVKTETHSSLYVLHRTDTLSAPVRCGHKSSRHCHPPLASAALSQPDLAISFAPLSPLPSPWQQQESLVSCRHTHFSRYTTYGKLQHEQGILQY